MVDQLFDTDCEASQNSVLVLSWGGILEKVMSQLLFSDEAWFHLRGYVNFRIKGLQKIMLFHEMSLHDFKVGVWYALSASMITGPPVFPSETTNTHQNVIDTACHLMNTCWIMGESMPLSQQDSATPAQQTILCPLYSRDCGLLIHHITTHAIFTCAEC